MERAALIELAQSAVAHEYGQPDAHCRRHSDGPGQSFGSGGQVCPWPRGDSGDPVAGLARHARREQSVRWLRCQRGLGSSVPPPRRLPINPFRLGHTQRTVPARVGQRELFAARPAEGGQRPHVNRFIEGATGTKATRADGRRCSGSLTPTATQVDTTSPSAATPHPFDARHSAASRRRRLSRPICVDSPPDLRQDGAVPRTRRLI